MPFISSVTHKSIYSIKYFARSKLLVKRKFGRFKKLYIKTLVFKTNPPKDTRILFVQFVGDNGACLNKTFHETVLCRLCRRERSLLRRQQNSVSFRLHRVQMLCAHVSRRRKRHHFWPIWLTNDKQSTAAWTRYGKCRWAVVVIGGESLNFITFGHVIRWENGCRQFRFQCFCTFEVDKFPYPFGFFKSLPTFQWLQLGLFDSPGKS